jgi:cytochrome c-type biogenesis protein CcmH
VALALLPFCALLAYLGLGRPDLIGQPPPAERRAQMDEAIQKLAERLKQNPNDLEGWVLLGRSLLAVEQPQRAAQAFDFARKLAPDNLDLKAFAAEAQAQAAGGSMAGQPAALADEIVAKDPNHPQGLWLAGLAAAERQDRGRAVSLWEKLQAQLPPDSPEAAEIARFIAEAKGAGGQPAAPAPAAAPGKRITVRVTLAKALQAKAAPEDALFVFARAAEGPPMPLAVARKQVKDLPLTVELDDAMAMMPGMNLSAFPRLVVGARISKSGKPTASPGDLQGLTPPVDAQDGSGYAVEVNSVVEAP